MRRGPTPSSIVKRSLVIAGHRTSISLEDAFWQGLKEIALDQKRSVGHLVAEIDRQRGSANLSSAIRVFVFTRRSATKPAGDPQEAADRTCSRAAADDPSASLLS